MRPIVVPALLLIGMAACVPAPTPAAPPPPLPAPVPAAADPPAVPRAFTIYFGPGRALVARTAMPVIEAAASLYEAGAPVALQITGYTDRVGAAGYNRRLAQRRAAHVAALLARKGVPRSAMRVAGRGESDLAVATPDGVSEPRNRRVTIIE